MMAFSKQQLWYFLSAIVLIRLMTLGFYPLMDTSEARYGEMARKMLTLNNWVTPMFDDSVPFWGKPPLSFWLQAASMSVFGINEFGVRFPAWLFHIFSCLLIIRLASRYQTIEQGLIAAILFSGSALGLVASGVVLTDPFLSFSLLLAGYGFWLGIQEQDHQAALLGFIGLGLGLLAKGPLVLVLLAIPAITWTAFTQSWRLFWQLPWLTGLTLMLAIACPWYLWAEKTTPGFLDYFLIGEHWKRYVISEWSGDLYGSAHAQAPGTIWLYLFAALLPASLFFPLLFMRTQSTPANHWRLFLWCWALTTPIFFTMAGNILWTYALPALPAWCLLLAGQLKQPKIITLAVALSFVLPLVLIIAIFDGRLFDRPQNQQEIVKAWDSASKHQPGELYYLYKRHYSAEFYSAGKSITAQSIQHLPANKYFYLAMRNRDKKRWSLPETLHCDIKHEANQSTLYYCLM